MQVKDAQKLEKKGDEALKTGMFKWSKDHASAAISYDEAVNIYQGCLEWNSAIRVQNKLMDVNKSLLDEWAIARNYETIISIHKKRKNYDVNTYKELQNLSFEFYNISNALNSFITMASNLVEFFEDDSKSKEALVLMKIVYERIVLYDCRITRNEFVGKYVNKLVVSWEYKLPMDILLKEVEFLLKMDNTSLKIATYSLGVIVLALILSDEVFADKHFMAMGNKHDKWFLSREAEFAEKMIRMYKDYEYIELTKLLRSARSSCIFPPIICSHLIKALELREKGVGNKNQLKSDFIIGKEQGDPNDDDDYMTEETEILIMKKDDKKGVYMDDDSEDDYKYLPKQKDGDDYEENMAHDQY